MPVTVQPHRRHASAKAQYRIDQHLTAGAVRVGSPCHSPHHAAGWSRIDSTSDGLAKALAAQRQFFTSPGYARARAFNLGASLITMYG
jgi:hypothetical protein